MNEILKKRIEEEADAEMSQYYNDDEYPCGIKDIQSDFKEAFKIGAEYALSHQWISVEDALPKEDEFVLFVDKNGSMQVQTLKNIRIQSELWEAKFMGVPSDWVDDKISIFDKIVAWLPIPKSETKKERI